MCQLMLVVSVVCVALMWVQQALGMWTGELFESSSVLTCDTSTRLAQMRRSHPTDTLFQ